ncbi:MAG: hypothetical protein ACI4W1_07170 [Ruminococcus sp.]
MLVKYIDKDNVTFADSRKILKYADKQVINPKEQDFINAGYKQLSIEEKPAYDTETQYLQPKFLDKENEVVQSWEIKNIESEE